ncbi:MAG: pyruvate kinase, partial [Terrimicrobiaceae bacterium]|nr:pyruvate kinase [Terrimicrobiaceae bacterium]
TGDGLVQLVVERVEAGEVHCRVTAGGELRSRKGLNLPGIKLGISAFTARDRECLEFALAHGVDAVSQSFVESPADILAVREAAQQAGGNPFIIAKIERCRALDNLDGILEAADGLMIARGDLGVEVPIERIALIQKQIISQAAEAGKPVITATQMLESMTSSRLPTRAEATDVANAILDGTDCLMLSGESAMGAYPEESVGMLARIAAEVESWREGRPQDGLAKSLAEKVIPKSSEEVLADIMERAIKIAPVSAVFVPTRAGYTARMISRFKPRAWIVAVCRSPATARGLAFSYGVEAVTVTEEPADWRAFAASWLRARGLDGQLAMLAADATPGRPDSNPRVEFLRLGTA